MKIKEKFKDENAFAKYIKKTFGIDTPKSKAREILNKIADKPFSLTGVLKAVKGIR